MKNAVFCVFALLAVGCRSEQDLRAMMQEEIAKASAVSFYPSDDVIGPYSPAVKAGPMLFVSGQIGVDPRTGKFAGEDIGSQTRQALTNLMGILTKAGYDSSNIVQCTVFLKDMKDFQNMNLIYGGFFVENKYPTRSTVEVSNLPKDARVEIAAIAFKAQ